MDATVINKNLEVARSLPWPPRGTSHAIPYGVFTEREVYDLEQERIFRGSTWNFVGLAAEVPEAGDFKSTFVGDTPVVMTRHTDGEIYCWVNRCSHRGAMICREQRGHNEAGTHTCVYHQWSFDNKGDLVGVPFRRGLGGHGGYPKDFKLEEHPVRKLKTEVYCGMVFATFDHDLETVEEHFGGHDSDVVRMIKRTMRNGTPLKVLGHSRQFIPSNWKFYAENTKDPYHASLLHLFHMTFGLYRSSQEGGVKVANGWHTILYAKSGTDSEEAIEQESDLRTYQEGTYKLQDMSLLAGRKEMDDNITLVITSLMPSLVLQHIQNTLAVRQIVPKSEREFELIWTFFGYADDDAEMDAIRLKQANLVGPAGLISMEDGESSVICQQAVVRDQNDLNVLEMGGRDIQGQDHLVTEATIRAFWKTYRELMDV